MKTRLLAISLMLIGYGFTQTAVAQGYYGNNYYPYSNYNNTYNNYRYTPSANYQSYPGYTQNYNRYANPGYNQTQQYSAYPYRYNTYNRSYSGNYPRAYSSYPYTYRPVYRKKKQRDFAEELWPGQGSIYDDILPADGPWNRNWGRAPWNRDYDNLWGKNGGPDAWINMDDPKEGMAQAWEDMLVTPNRLGTMPGGWYAPSISVPNPIDVGDEFKDTAKNMPGEMRDFSDGFTYGGDDYGRSDDDGGISINSNRNR